MDHRQNGHRLSASGFPVWTESSRAPESLVLWTGPKHSGKTTAAARLVQAVRARGLTVAGCLAPALYEDGRLAGFDVLDLRTGGRATLARRPSAPDEERGFRFEVEGLELGGAALSPAATRDADLIIIDEFGPLELAGQGWRAATDCLMTSTTAVLLLVVREELAAEVRQLYGGIPARAVVATEQGAIDEILTLLANRRESPS